MPDRFNIRVYGILIDCERLLVNEEKIGTRLVTKFPGGGLELGEGIADGLKREWKEELGLDIEIGDHFYTTDFFQQSAFDNSQVISIYYLIHLAQLPESFTNNEPNEHTFWLPLSKVNADTFHLPIDKVVGQMLCTKHATRSL
ncbi:MAG: NUDIX hydrolase [Bacteroidetes bacterium]|nr:NUDIX hydrolase [Bacteroidota bacterium]MBS1741034.1 NUDIX hydrolase [Bacteroidota bacterium]